MTQRLHIQAHKKSPVESAFAGLFAGPWQGFGGWRTPFLMEAKSHQLAPGGLTARFAEASNVVIASLDGGI